MERLNHLNAAQREAVLTRSGPLLVLAGAGTGKTRVITHRLVELIRSGTRPERILSVTFTNKAAQEMQQRAALLLGRRRANTKPFISTFHALCVRILRQEISALGYPPDFVIYDRSDQLSTARTALKDIRLDAASLRPLDLLNRISRWKTAGRLPKTAGQHAETDFDLLAAAAYRRYQAHLRARGAVDFDDLLLLTKQLFEQHPAALRRHQQRFDHVQIDEYQDTNATQFVLVEALVRPHRNLCVVGDDDQSIYGWRGANVEHILHFQRHFPGAKVVRLERNYRSTTPILQLANRLVQHNPGRHQKTLIAGRRSHAERGNEVESAVRCFEFPDEAAEAEGIVGEITDLVTRQHVPPRDVAILFRTNDQPRVLETELRRRRVPYTLIGGQSFFDRKEIRDLLAYLKAIARPSDDGSLLRIINTPSRGIGTATVEKLLKRAVAQSCSVWDRILHAVAQGDVSAPAATALAEFRALLDRYRRRFREAPSRMDAALAALIEDIGYHTEIKKHYKTPDQQQVRQAALLQLVEAMKEYLRRSSQPTLGGFLEESALLGREEEPDTENQLTENAVKLITLHSAKGLEFPRVYVVGLEEGLLPHRRAVDAADGAIAEERRLLYVGITRAMDHLTLSRAANRCKWGKRRPSLPSRFLLEMGHGAATPS